MFYVSLYVSIFIGLKFKRNRINSGRHGTFASSVHGNVAVFYGIWLK